MCIFNKTILALLLKTHSQFLMCACHTLLYNILLPSSFLYSLLASSVSGSRCLWGDHFKGSLWLLSEMGDHFYRFQTTAHRCHLTAFWLSSQGFSVDDQAWTVEYCAGHRSMYSWNCGGLRPHGVSFDQLEMGSGGYICPSLPHKMNGDKMELIQLLRGCCSEIGQSVSLTGGQLNSGYCGVSHFPIPPACPLASSEYTSW